MMRPFSDVDLHAFVDGQVNPERRALIDAYLKATPAEAARVDQWKRQNEAIRGAFSAAASEPVPLWLTIGQVASGRDRPAARGLDPIQDNRAARPATARHGTARTSRRHGSHAWKPACLFVAAFAAGLALPYAVPEWPAAVEHWLPATPRVQQMQRLADRTLEAHRTFGVDPDRPVEVTDTPPGTLAAWFKRHVGFPVRVPDLRRAGWTLRGGRVVPGDAGAAALMVFEDAVGDRLSLVAARVSNPAPSDTAFTVLDGPTLVWLDGPVGFGIATSKERPWLADNARSLYRGVYEGAAD